MEHFFDSYAIIEITGQNPNYAVFRDEAIITTALNIAETHYILTGKAGEEAADEIIDNLDVSLLEFTKSIAVEASKLRHKHKKQKMSYADCLGYIAALKHGLKFLTGDDAFKGMADVEFVK
jgi:predicted nucleic acid-binding protein